MNFRNIFSALRAKPSSLSFPPQSISDDAFDNLPPMDIKLIPLDEKLIAKFLSEREGKIVTPENGTLPSALEINPFWKPVSRFSERMLSPSSENEIHVFYLDFRNHSNFYAGSSPAAIASSAVRLHPETAHLILEDEIKNAEAGIDFVVSQRNRANLLYLASKAPNGLDAAEKALAGNFLKDSEEILRLISRNPDIQITKETMTSLSFSEMTEIRNVDFSKQKNAGFLNTENMSFVNCTFGPEMSKKQLARARSFIKCTFAKELGLTHENVVGEKLEFPPETQLTRFFSIGNTPPSTPPPHNPFTPTATPTATPTVGGKPVTPPTQ